MKILKNPPRETWPAISERPQLALEFLESAVRNILNRVRKSGDQALRELTLQFDKALVKELRVSDEEIARAADAIPEDLKDAIRAAAANISKFHAGQRRDDLAIETMPGVTCWRRPVPIGK